MNNDNNKISDKVLSEAGKWVAREIAGDISRTEKIELEAWLNADIDHQHAYLRSHKMAALLDDQSTPFGREELTTIMPDLQGLMDECKDLSSLANKRKHSLWANKWVSAVAATLLIAIISTVLVFQSNPSAKSYATQVGELETVMLEDGSILTLNTNTRLSVAYSDTERRILLDFGEVYFDVAKDISRPFNVITNKDVVRAVGTAFNVKKRDYLTNVTVTEGVVEFKSESFTTTAHQPNKIEKTVSLKVGATLTIDANGIENNILSPIELEKATSWRTGLLHFNGTRLSIVVKELQNYAHKEIILTDNKVGDLIVGGSLNTKNITAYLKGLELTFPLKVIERDSVIILSYERPAIMSSAP